MDNNTVTTQEIENSYILREYFKGFKLNTNDIFKIRDKFNKTDRNIILDSVVKQNTEIYNIIGENYSSTVNKFEQISEQINLLNEQLTSVYNDNLVLFNLRSSNDDHNSSSSTDGDKEPTSIKQLNSNINDNLNKIQQVQNEIQAKNNVIDNKLNQIKDDDNFLIEVEQEKEIYIENLSDEVLEDLVAENGAGFTYPYLYKLILILFDYVYTIAPASPSTADKPHKSELQYLQNENNKAKIFKEFKKEIYSRKIGNLKNKLKNCQNNDLFIGLTSIKGDVKFTPSELREINQILENLKTEAETEVENGVKNKIYEKFFFPIYKTLKLVVFIALGKIRVDKLKDSVENDRDEIYSLNNNIKDLLNKNSVMERLKNEINKKYENRSGDVGNSSKNGDSMSISGGVGVNGTKNNQQINQSNNKSKQKQAITKLKLLHNELEHNYILLLKNMSKKIIKPKDLINRKYDQEYLSNKIK